MYAFFYDGLQSNRYCSGGMTFSVGRVFNKSKYVLEVVWLLRKKIKK